MIKVINVLFGSLFLIALMAVIVESIIKKYTKNNK
jgi:hypothetical protein